MEVAASRRCDQFNHGGPPPTLPLPAPHLIPPLMTCKEKVIFPDYPLTIYMQTDITATNTTIATTTTSPQATKEVSYKGDW